MRRQLSVDLLDGLCQKGSLTARSDSHQYIGRIHTVRVVLHNFHEKKPRD